jgi:hypothetical protein
MAGVSVGQIKQAKSYDARRDTSLMLQPDVYLHI